MSILQSAYKCLVYHPKAQEYKGFLTKHQIDTHFHKHHYKYYQYVVNYLKSQQKSPEDFITLMQDNYNNNSALSNNCQQLFNHNLFWKSLIDNNVSLEENQQYYQKLDKLFDITQQLQQCNLFGSGWLWLIKNDKNELIITETANAHLPQINLSNILATIDLWEHAYYLDYLGNRKEYINNIIKYIDWIKILKILYSYAY